VGYVATDHVAVWYGAAVLGGMGAAAVWNATEALLATHAPPDQRGRVMGLYQTGLGAALALGPFAPGLLQISAQQVLWGAALALIAATLVACTTRDPSSAPTSAAPTLRSLGKRMNTWDAMRKVPALILLAFAGGVFEAGLGAVSAAHGASTGLSLASATAIVGAIGLGSFAFQYPAGVLADRFSLNSAFTVAGVLLLASSLALIASHHAAWLLWCAAVVWGGVGGALYTLTIICVAHDFTPQATPQASAAEPTPDMPRNVTAGSAAVITGYTYGGAAGPLISGSALQWVGVWGLALWLAVLSLAVLWAARQSGKKA
jgi:MFS family permease